MVAAVAIRLVYKNRWYLRYWLFRVSLPPPPPITRYQVI